MINNSKEIKFNLNGLASNKSYIYEIKSAGGNWPAQVSPNSGIIIGNRLGDNVIYTTITFCAITGHCQTGESIGLLDYDITQCGIDAQVLQTSVKLSIIEEATDLEIIGYPVQVLCTDCFSPVSISEPLTLNNVLLQRSSPLRRTLSTKLNNSIDFYVPVSGLQRFEEYAYSFGSLNMNNWPVTITPISGYITSSTGKASIFASMKFCQSSGECSDNENLLNYTEDSFVEKQSLRNIFDLTITPNRCNGNPVTSAPMSMYCNDCLPKLSVSIEPRDLILAPSNVNSANGNVAVISSIIEGLDDDIEYTYTINSSEANWPVSVNPVSGYIRNQSQATIYSKATFCLSTGECPVGADKIMDYEIPGDECLEQKNKYSKMSITLSAANGNAPSITTRDFTISCDNCLPKTVVQIPSVPSLVGIGNNRGSLSAPIYNLRPYQTYAYEIEPIDANWPVVCYPISGILTTSSLTTGRIATNYIFCPSTGDCPNGSENVIDYVSQTGSSCVYKDTGDRFSNIRIVITPLSCYDPIIKSEIISLNCRDCIPRVRITSPATVSLRGSLAGNIADVNIIAQGLELQKQYVYSFIGSEANWPIIVFPKSGTLDGNLQARHNISTSFIFCATTGSCSAGDANLIPYNLDIKDTNVYKQLDKLRGKLRLEVYPASCPEEKVISEDIEISCDDCLPKIVIDTSRISTDIRDDKFILPVYIDGLSMGETYSYEIIEQDSTWPTYLSPMTGQITSLSNVLPSVLDFDVRFCNSTGLCPSGSPNILDYNPSNTSGCNYGSLKNPIKQSSFKLQITPQSYNGDVVLSDLVKVRCVDCLPKINISLDPAENVDIINNSITVANGTNTHSFASSVSGLIIGQEYSYLFSSTEANWPVVALPVSGSFIAKANTKNIVSTLKFCHTTGSCPSSGVNILDYELTSSCPYGQVSDSNPFAKLNLKIVQESCGGDVSGSQDFTLNCDKCLNPLISVDPSQITALTDRNTGILPVSVIGLKPLETYSYAFSGIDSNWPTVISPATGSFKSTRLGLLPYNSPLVSRYYFCSPTGLCPAGTPGLINYDLDSYLDQKIQNNFLYTKVKLIITDSSCDTVQTASEEILLSCTNCLPKISYANIAFGGGNGNEIVLPTGCCSGVKALSVNVTNAIPGEKYSYAFSGSYVGSFYPVTGSAYFNNGVGVINTLGTIDIAPSGQSLISCVLTHNATNVSSLDFMAITCGSGLRVTTCN
jgi:hypothetical protein